MKKGNKIITSILALVMLGSTLVAATSCGGGTRVTYSLPDGVTATLPENVKCEPYAEIELPAIKVDKAHYEQIGWEDEFGEFYANGDKITVGEEGIKLTAVLRGTEIFVSFCENAGNFFMAGKGDLGPTPAYTHFYADNTWEAVATGKAMYTTVKGTWKVDANGNLSMNYVNQDGIAKTDAVEVDTSDSRIFSWTFSHPADRGGLKYHKNHADRAAFLTAVKNEFGSSFAIPAAGEYKMTFQANKGVGDDFVITAKVGEKVKLPACNFTYEGKTFNGWQVKSSQNVTMQPGDTFEMVSWDIVVAAQWN